MAVTLATAALAVVQVMAALAVELLLRVYTVLTALVVMAAMVVTAIRHQPQVLMVVPAAMAVLVV